MIAHICRLSLRHKSSIQANSYRLPYARSSYGSLTYLHQKLRRCLQFPLPRKKRLLRLCPDITGEAALQDDVGSTTGIISGAFVRGTRYRNTISGLAGVQSYALKIEASRSNSTFGINYSGVSVSAAYSLIIIKA